MSGWITFWTYACLIGFSAFYLLVLVVVPLGALDLVKLFKHLKAGGDRDSEADETR